MSRVSLAAAFLLVVVATDARLVAQNHMVSSPCCGFTDSVTGTNVTIVPVNTTVQWNKVGATPHTVTNGVNPSDPQAGLLFNGNLAGAVMSFTHLFNQLGTFPYHCSFHFTPPFSMVGTVHVLPPATASSVGTGCASSAGTLTLGVTSLPKVGNAGFGFTVSGGAAGTPAYLYISLGIAASPLQVSGNCFAYLDLVSTQAFITAGITPTGPNTLGAGGTTTFPFPLPLQPGLGGASGAAQVLVFDGAAPGGFALSNAIAVTIGA
jgi:plastocyanin